jgi:pimeloyl-ACP methyl ester carboxylesterase
MFRTALLVVLLVLHAPPVAAQVQDSTLDNLVHDPGYVTAAPGVLGKVIERGKGRDLVLISGFGLGVSAFESFMSRNASRYHMLAITLPGFEGTAAPPMPPAGTSYGEQTWTRQAADAVAKLIADRKLKKPVLVGHFINGTQVAMRVALEHPEQVSALVLLAGTPRFEPVQASPFWPQNLTLDQKVRAVDQFTAPRWFKTVTRATWVKGNFVATDYSVVDSVRGARFANLANDPPLPVLIRWLCEFHASDLWPAIPKLAMPLLVLRPGFTPALAADSTRNYLQSYFEGPWKGRLDDAGVETAVVPNAAILVMDDQPGIVDRKVAEFLKQRK